MKPIHTGAEALRAISRIRQRVRSDVEASVRATIQDVEQRGDAALLDLVHRLDAPELDSLEITPDEIESAALPRDEYEAIRTAIHRVRHFHLTQLEVLLGGAFDFSTRGFEDLLDLREERPGICARWALAPPPGRLEGRTPVGGDFGVGQIIRSIAAAGIYVPGGRATYPSSVIMNAVPATAALVPRIVVTTPPRRDGTLAPAVLVAMREVGIQGAYKVGGAAAIAALALGTETVTRVDIIAGPGNSYVNEAKRQLWGAVGLDGPAGPSEVVVIADATASPRLAAEDLLTQIEHAPDNLGFLVAIGETVARRVETECLRIIARAERGDILRESFARVPLLVARDEEEAIVFANAVAAEHASLAVESPERYVGRLAHAGALVLGRTPESAGDYVAGPSHTLPTGGAARWSSPVNAFTFLRFQSVIGLTDDELRDLAPTIAAFSRMEGLPLHGAAASRGRPPVEVRRE